MDWNTAIIQLAETIHKLKGDAEYFRIMFENEHRERLVLEQRLAKLTEALKEDTTND